MYPLTLIVVLNFLSTIALWVALPSQVTTAALITTPPILATNRNKVQKTNKMKSAVKKPITRHYIFGYGSLVCSKSRKITAPTLTKPAHPVVIHHLRRTWTARVPVMSGDDDTNSKHGLNHAIQGHTAMGIEIAKGHNCTGVLLEVDPSELAKFDEREKGYDRVEIDLHHIFGLDDKEEENVQRDQNDSSNKNDSDERDQHHVLKKAHQRRKSMQAMNSQGSSQQNQDNEDETLDDLKVWAYIPKGGGAGADHNFPIMQSYVDIILRGCLSISKDFAQKFLESTHGWWHDETIHDPNSEPPEYVWVDDRHAPYYVRADEEWSSEMKHMLDDLLKEIHPEPFQKRRHLNALGTSDKNNNTQEGKTSE